MSPASASIKSTNARATRSPTSSGWCKRICCNSNALLGKHISTIDAALRQRTNQFNYGLANDLASIKWLPTVPLLILDGNGITKFKHAGGTTSLFIGGGSFTKYGNKPLAYLSGNTVKNDSFFSRKDEIEVKAPNASMGLMEIAIPNNVIPDDYGPQTFGFRNHHHRSNRRDHRHGPGGNAQWHAFGQRDRSGAAVKPSEERRYLRISLGVRSLARALLRSSYQPRSLATASPFRRHTTVPIIQVFGTARAFKLSGLLDDSRSTFGGGSQDQHFRNTAGFPNAGRVRVVGYAPASPSRRELT